jgi:hypothetical protein
MIIVIISITFVLIVATAIFLPMILHNQTLKAACDTDADCGKGSKCVLDPNTKRKTCIPESKKFCSMFENNLTSCNLETDSVCTECESGPNDLKWACQSSLWDAENGKPRNSCNPSPSLKPCKPGPGGTCDDGCSENEICIPPTPGGALGPNATGDDSGRCSLPRTWHKTKLLCEGNDEKSIRDCEEKCKKVFGEWENNKCIVFEKTVVPPGSVHPLDKKCKVDSDCNAKNGELCANGKCAQIQGWCQIPLQKSEDCNEYTGTYTLKQNTDKNGKTTYEWVCLCDTNLFDRGTMGSSCINLTGCQGGVKGNTVYIPDPPNKCDSGGKCGGESICIDKKCYIPWEGEIANSRSPYPCDGDKCGYGVNKDLGGSVCDCGPNGSTKVVNLLPNSDDSKLWYMYCDNQDQCKISGGNNTTAGDCECDWPLMQDKNKKSCLPDPCFPGYTTSAGVCYCPNRTQDKSTPPQYGPSAPPIPGGWWWDKNNGKDFYPYLSDEGPICSPICEDNPCGDNGTCTPTKDKNGSYYMSCQPCKCGSSGEFCQYASEDNNIPPGTLCIASPGAPVCCGAPNGTSAEEDENPCVVGRLSPFVRAGLSDDQKALDNNPKANNHEGNKLGFCYKPCGKAGPDGKIDPHTPDQSACAEDESCVLLPKNAYKYTSNQSGVKDFRAYCTKNITDFDNTKHPEAGPSCYANSFKLNKDGENDICTDWKSSGDKNTCASFRLGDADEPTFDKNSSLCCFNNPRGQTGSSTNLPTCLYNCDGPGGGLEYIQSNCDHPVYYPFWD